MAVQPDEAGVIPQAEGSLREEPIGRYRSRRIFLLENPG